MNTETGTSYRADRPLVLALLLLVPASLMAVVAAGTGTLPGDIAVSKALQGAGIPGAGQIEQLGYVLGGTPLATGVALVLALLLYLRRLALSAVMFAAATVVLHVNFAIKWLVASPRPTSEQVRVTEEANFYGFPSGHVMTAVIIFGLAFVLAPAIARSRLVQYLVRAGAVVAILATSFGRVYSGAHWPSDVVGGYLWGAVVLLMMVAAYRAMYLRWGEALSDDGMTPAHLTSQRYPASSPEST